MAKSFAANVIQLNQAASKPYQSQPYNNLNLLYIGGQWRKGRSKKPLEDQDPFTGKTIISVQGASADDINEAYQAAKMAQPKWAFTPPQARRDVFLRAINILVQRREEIVEWLIKETGSTRIKATIEWQLVHDGTIEAATYPFRASGEILPCSIPGKESRVYRRPVGVVGVISPWDFSFQLTNRSVAPALAAGNSVVLKPASKTPVTGGMLFAKIYEEAGLPPGVLNVVVGHASEIGDAFVTHPIPRMITFTGSTEAGKHIGMLAGQNLKKSALELGGNGPFIVLEDADLDVAAHAAVVGKFLNAGQICMAINRIIVDRKVHDQFLGRFVDRVKALKWGDPSQPETDYGPMITKKQFDAVRKLVDETVKAGATVVLDGPSQGLVMHPVILTNVTNDMPAAKNEIFGPVAVIIQVDGEEEAIRVANDTEYGLSSAICSRDIARALETAQRIEAGMTHINDIPVNDEANSPFGGEKQSGYGRFGGVWALNEFTTEHWITVQHEPRQYPF